MQPFLLAPLLKESRYRKLIKDLLLHTLVLAFIALLAFIVRRAMGDHRVAEFGGTVFFLPIKMLTGMFIGPVVSMAQWLLGPARVLLSLDVSLIVTIVVGSLTLICVFSKMPYQSPVVATAAFPVRAKLLGRGFSKFGDAFAGTAPVGIAGLVWIATAYGLAFTHFPPIAQFGRMTSVHVAASLGASLLIAWILSTALWVSGLYGVKKFAVAAIGVYFALLAGYGVRIQKDYDSSWQNQRSFWTQVVNLTPDAGDGTLIFAIKEGLPETRYILTHSWADPIIFGADLSLPHKLESCASGVRRREELD